MARQALEQRQQLDKANVDACETVGIIACLKVITTLYRRCFPSAEAGMLADMPRLR